MGSNVHSVLHPVLQRFPVLFCFRKVTACASLSFKLSVHIHQVLSYLLFTMPALHLFES